MRVDPLPVGELVEEGAIEAAVDKVLARDKAEQRKAYRSLTDADVWALLDVPGFPGKGGSVTVAKPGAAQFDFDAEVKEHLNKECRAGVCTFE